MSEHIKMETKKYTVQIYFSGFHTVEIEATGKEEAILKATKIEIDKNEILSNLEEWEEAHTAEESED